VQSASRARKEDATIVIVWFWLFRRRIGIAAAPRHDDVRVARLWCPRPAATVRKLVGGTFLLSGLAACSVYETIGVDNTPAPDAGERRDGDEDAIERDAGGPSDDATGGRGGSGGTGGADVRDANGEGGFDVGTSDASEQDARTDGDSGQDGGVPDGRADVESGDDAPNDDASDAIADVAQDCVGSACDDAPAVDADGGVDQCPTDPAKTEPGICGCNADDPPDLDAGSAYCLKALLAHRYSFNGSGTVATDSIAMANGTIMGGSNANMSGGSVSLTGDLGSRYTSEGYVSLPSDLLNPLVSATFEVWLTWRGTGSSGSTTWQRIFDFGDQVTSGSELVGKTYLFLTARAPGSGFPRAAFSPNGSANETIVTATQAIALNTQTHLAVVVDDANDNIVLYLNGSLAGSVAWTGALTSINDVNAWLGRSNYGVDPELNGILHEFRIYRVALNAAQVGTSYAAGPDPAFF
jgi:hypothetical protein